MARAINWADAQDHSQFLLRFDEMVSAISDIAEHFAPASFQRIENQCCIKDPNALFPSPKSCLELTQYANRNKISGVEAKRLLDITLGRSPVPVVDKAHLCERRVGDARSRVKVQCVLCGETCSLEALVGRYVAPL